MLDSLLSSKPEQKFGDTSFSSSEVEGTFRGSMPGTMMPDDCEMFFQELSFIVVVRPIIV